MKRANTTNRSLYDRFCALEARCKTLGEEKEQAELRAAGAKSCREELERYRASDADLRRQLAKAEARIAALEERNKFASQALTEESRLREAAATESASLRDQANRLFILHIPCISGKVVDRVLVNDVHSPVSECYLDEEADVHCHHLNVSFNSGNGLLVRQQEVRKRRVSSLPAPPTKHPRV